MIPATPSEAEAYTVRTTELARRCGAAMGPLLSRISTADTARDMEHLRRLLGEEQITYVGLSYGTVVGQVYANLFPQHVRAMVLVGVVDPVAYSTDAETRSLSRSASVPRRLAEPEHPGGPAHHPPGRRRRRPGPADAGGVAHVDTRCTP